MVTKTDIELKNFFVFNSNLSSKEGEELKKILFYHPSTDNGDLQIKNVGLVEGIIQFTETFKPSSPVSSLHTANTRQLYFQPEKNFWMIMTLNLPSIVKVKDGLNNVEKLEDNLQDNVYEAVLKQSYYMYRLFWGTFSSIENTETLMKTLETFFKAYLSTLKLASADILNIFSGIQYLPLDSNTFLKVQCFINSLESKFPVINHSSFLYNDHLIWSDIEPPDMQVIYQYLIGTLLPANMEAELQGGSMPRNAPSPFAALHHGRFITGPSNLKLAKTVGKVPKVFLYGRDGPVTELFLVVYRALSASVCLFLQSDADLTLNLFRELDTFMSPKLVSIVSSIADYCSKEVVTPSSLPETSPKFIYFNKLNLAYKSTVHLDNKQTGNVACSKDSLRIMADINEKNPLLGYASETIVKTMNDYWVVGKSSNSREFYIALQQKNASLIDVSDEVKKLCDTELKGIFFHPT